MLATPDERVFLEARPHGVVLARPLARALGLAAVGGLALWLLPGPFAVLGAAFVAAGAILTIAAVWTWERTHVVVTTEKLFLVRGTLHRRASAVSLRSLGSLEVEQSLPGRLLDYGTLVAGPLEIKHLPEPKRVCRLVERLAS